MELPNGTRLGDIQTFGVRFKSGKSSVFDTGDNWNMDNIKVTFAGSSNCSGTLIEQQGSPFVRFTGDRREWRTNVRIP
ncbi:hypothetical protein F7734_41495 [Scytonema sp. UIC 10036]|uniref:hypothetical protein n=1 Tax=Scytonema sp. UIC 10036 TaxID=2304196 RepID=UPI0012DA6C99|nr:hypothetical protein [Scytonema sp. UIC 10036]MUG98435.1 hypothetical protein [Scytonema sp. UIC 10036]